MAIKTKKISDLVELTRISENTYFLGINGESTGKVCYSKILDDVNNIVNNKVEGAALAMAAAMPAPLSLDEEVQTSEEVKELGKRVDDLQSQLSDTISAYKSLQKKYNSYVKSNAETILTLQNTIGELSLTVENLVSFVQSLQKDGYLTLAEIRKAAADACPICNHTHEEETTTEA